MRRSHGDPVRKISPRAVGQLGEGELTGPQELKDHGRISIIVLGAAQILSLPMSLQGERVDQAEAVASAIQEISEVPPVVAGGLHPEKKMVSLSFSPGSLHLLQESFETLMGVGELESGKHLSSQIHHYASMSLLADIDPYQEGVRLQLCQPFCGTIEHVGCPPSGLYAVLPDESILAGDTRSFLTPIY
ncbi:MAG: hypothetical protein WBH57_10100 [Anaerolineae bacterium]